MTFKPTVTVVAEAAVFEWLGRADLDGGGPCVLVPEDTR